MSFIYQVEYKTGEKYFFQLLHLKVCVLLLFGESKKFAYTFLVCMCLLYISIEERNEEILFMKSIFTYLVYIRG